MVEAVGAVGGGVGAGGAGEWLAAEEHARAAVARSGDYELMVVAAGVARAEVPAARGDHEAVLRALEPVVGLAEREGVDEPGFWPWQDLYGGCVGECGAVGARRRSSWCRMRSWRRRGGGGRWWRGWRGCGGGWRRRGVGCRRRRRRSVGGWRQLEGLSVPFQRALLELALWAGVAAGGAAAGGGGAVVGGAGAVCRVAGAAVSGAV